MSEKLNDAFSFAKVILSFLAGALSTTLSIGVLAKPAVERIADERAAIVEARLRSYLSDYDSIRRSEFETIRSEIRALRAELMELIKERKHK